jgi:hypothetical protein
MMKKLYDLANLVLMAVMMIVDIRRMFILPGKIIRGEV